MSSFLVKKDIADLPPLDNLALDSIYAIQKLIILKRFAPGVVNQAIA